MTVMDKGARNWLLRVAKKNYWRVVGWYEIDDLIQDGHLIWAMVVERYETRPGRVRSRRHLMALFKVCYINHITALANAKTRTAERVVADLLLTERFLSETETWDLAFKVEDVSAHNLLIAELPPQLRELMRLLETGDTRKLRYKYRRLRANTRETFNSRLCKLLGVDTSTDIADTLRNLLRPA